MFFHKGLGCAKWVPNDFVMISLFAYLPVTFQSLSSRFTAPNQLLSSVIFCDFNDFVKVSLLLKNAPQMYALCTSNVYPVYLKCTYTFSIQTGCFHKVGQQKKGINRLKSIELSNPKYKKKRSLQCGPVRCFRIRIRLRPVSDTPCFHSLSRWTCTK